MPAGIGVEGRNAHEAVNSAFCFQEAVGKFTIELERTGLDAGTIAFYPVEDRHLPALLFAIHAVHTREYFGPVLAFGATGAGVDLQYGGQLVFGLVERAFEFSLFNGLYGLVVGGFYFFFTALSFFPEFKKDGKVLNGRFYLFVQVYPVFVELDLFYDGGGPGIIVPEAGSQ
jgi:hypothetical protein